MSEDKKSTISLAEARTQAQATQRDARYGRRLWREVISRTLSETGGGPAVGSSSPLADCTSARVWLKSSKRRRSSSREGYSMPVSRFHSR